MSVSLQAKLVLLVVLVGSVVLHELGHALSALAFGDDTAKRAGHLTLNPWTISPFGAVILPALLILVGATPIAFAATPVNPRNMRNPRLHGMLCSLAGPAVNLVLIGASVLLLRGVHGGYVGGVSYREAAFDLGYINVILAVFNLLPVPPLDGSAVLERVMPRQWWPSYVKFRQWGMGVLILVVLATPLLGDLLSPFLRLWARTWTQQAVF